MLVTEKLCQISLMRSFLTQFVSITNFRDNSKFVTVFRIFVTEIFVQKPIFPLLNQYGSLIYFKYLGVVDGQHVNIFILPFVGPEGPKRLG